MRELSEKEEGKPRDCPVTLKKASFLRTLHAHIDKTAMGESTHEAEYKWGRFDAFLCSRLIRIRTRELTIGRPYLYPTTYLSVAPHFPKGKQKKMLPKRERIPVQKYALQLPNEGWRE